MESRGVEAQGVNTVAWLSEAVASVAVPVYQRNYRWSGESCRRLLDDIRAAARRAEGHVHFIGSVLATRTAAEPGLELTLIDGQQRITTLMLLVAALHRSWTAGSGPLEELRKILVHPTRTDETKLVPRKHDEKQLADIVLTGLLPNGEREVSALVSNYQLFLAELHDDPEVVWRGLQRLEHVAITVSELANPQQVFESLNATGTPLENHELIHNYVLMGLSVEEQVEVEDSYWVPVEGNTAPVINAFWRDYLIQRTGRDSDLGNGYGVYGAFKAEFPRLDLQDLQILGSEWEAMSHVYRLLLNPEQAQDDEIEARLRGLAVFGAATYPLAMMVLRAYRGRTIDRAQLLDTLQDLESLYLRKMVVGEGLEHLAAQLCRRLTRFGFPIHDLVRRMPSDERVRAALKHRRPPHVDYVLKRLQGVAIIDGLEIEHVFPQTPDDSWTGDQERRWVDHSEEERARYRELLQTLGNLTLLEQPLNAQASNRPFHQKKPYYECSAVEPTRSLTQLQTWDVPAIEARTAVLTDRFLSTWKRPSNAGEEDEAEHLVPILDALKRPGFYPGWRTEFEYVRFCGEVWEVRDVKTLFNRVFKRLWTTRRQDVLSFLQTRRGPIFEREEWRGQWEALDGSHYLFMGLFPQYMLGDVQEVLDALQLSEDVFVKYSVDDDVQTLTAAAPLG